MTVSTPPKAPRSFVSLGTRLTVPVAALVALVAAGAYFGLVGTSRVTAMRSKEEAADMVVKLTSLSVMPAVVFADEIETKRAVADLARNPQVTDVELWAFDSELPSQSPLASFHRDGQGALKRPTSARPSRSLEAESITAVEPVKAPDGKTVAMLAVRFSTARETAVLAALSRQVLWVSLVSALLLTGSILWVLRRLVLSPIRDLQSAARRLASGQAKAPATDKKRNSRFDDEVAQLTRSFREMAAAVRDRELRLGVRNAELRLILDNVEQGFLTLLPDGSVQAERSTIVESWVGALPEPAYLWHLIGRIDPSYGERTRLGWDQVLDGFLPLEVALEQLPKRVARQGRHFDFAYHPVMDGDVLAQVVVVMTDVTSEVERQRALAEQHEFSVLVDRFVRDRRGFHDSWGEGSALVTRILGQEASGDSLRRDLHTLKGNARYLSLSRLAEICHSLEDYLQEHTADVLEDLGRERLREAWDALNRRMEPLLSGTTAFIEISEQEYERLVVGLGARLPHASLEELVRGLRDEPTEWRLKRAEEALLQVCRKLRKSSPAVQIDHGDLRLPPGRLASFWNVLQHVVSNAADHGIESDDERKKLGKPLPATVRLSTKLEDREVLVEVTDDGRGIDWSSVRNRAIEKGLPHATQADLEQALFADGFSLSERVSETSGRGVGLAAVRTVVSALGGSIEITSKQGHGTKWSFRLRIGALGEPQAANEAATGKPLATPAV